MFMVSLLPETYEVNFLMRAYNWNIFLSFINICLLIDVLVSFTFKAIIDMLKLLKSVVLLLFSVCSFYVYHSVIFCWLPIGYLDISERLLFLSNKANQTYLQ